ncbi:MAG: hypothetical protein R2736_09760 [Solirubrobacterales bacterium]
MDLGSYEETTLELLALDDDARRAGCRVVPGSGAGPGLIALLGRHGADQLTSVRSIEALLASQRSDRHVAGSC